MTVKAEPLPVVGDFEVHMAFRESWISYVKSKAAHYPVAKKL